MASAKGTITFKNASAFNTSVYTVAANGKEAFVIELSPDQSSQQETVEGQVWIVQDKDTGRQVGTVTGKAGDQTYEIRFRRSRDTPDQTRGGGG